MACCECPKCGWMGNESRCPKCGMRCNFDEEGDHDYPDDPNEEQEREPEEDEVDE